MRPELDRLASQSAGFDRAVADRIQDYIVHNACLAATRAISPHCSLGYYLSNNPAFAGLAATMRLLRTAITEHAMGIGKPRTGAA